MNGYIHIYEFDKAMKNKPLTKIKPQEYKESKQGDPKSQTSTAPCNRKSNPRKGQAPAGVYNNK